MKKIFVVILGLILLRIVYDYIDSQNYFSEFEDSNFISRGEPYAEDEYKSYQSSNHIKDTNKTKIELHIDYSDIKDIKTKHIAIYMYQPESKLHRGIYYDGVSADDIFIEAEENMMIHIIMLDHQNKKAYSFIQRRESEWGKEFIEHKNAYIKLRKDGKIDVKFNKYLPYFWVPWVNKNDTPSRYFLALILSILD